MPKLGTLALRVDLLGFAASPEPSASGIEQAQAEIAQFVARQDLQAFPRWTKKELEQSRWGKKRQSEYKRLRQAHPDWDNQTQVWRTLVAEETPTATVPVTKIEFASLSDLLEQAQHVAAQLCKGDER